MTLSASLKQIPLFHSLPAEILEELAGTLKIRALQAGEILFHLGEAGEEMIIVRRGKIAIYMPEDGNPGGGQILRIFKPGEILGEMALIDRLPRSTSARAETKAVVTALDFDSFQNLIKAHPEVSMSVMSGLSGRIRYTTNFIGEMRQWIQKMAEGKYQEIGSLEKTEDDSLSALAADFVRMAAQVREREEKLQREVAQLRIEIDETKRRQEVARITGSEYYMSLKEKLKALREEDEEFSPPGETMRLIYETIETPDKKKESP